MQKVIGKYLLFLWLLPVWSVTASANVNLGPVSSTDYARFPVFCLDSAGFDVQPDSVHVLIWFEGETTGNSESYSIRSATGGASSGLIDSTTLGSATQYYFVDQIADLDNDEGNGVYVGDIVLWDAQLPTHNHFSFTLVADELTDLFDSLLNIGDEVAMSLDSLQAYDDWVATQVEVVNLDGWNPNADSVLVDGSTLAATGGAITSTTAPNLDVAVSTRSTIDSAGLSRIVGRKVWGVAEGSGSDSTGLNDRLAVMADTTRLGHEVAVMPDDWNAADSLGFQGSGGSGGGLDSSGVARAVWNTPSGNHTTAGTFGKYVDAEISGIGTGGGAYTTSLVAYDTAVDQVVPGVHLAVRNLDQSGLLATGSTSADGTLGVNLDADDYIVTATAPGYIFDAYDTITIVGSQVDSIVGCQFDPGTPASPGLCRVYGYLYTLEGQAEEGAVVTAYLPSGVARLSGLVISPFPVTTTCTSSGYFQLDLIPSSLLSGNPVYEITINRTDGTILRKRLNVPDSGSWEITW